MVVTHKRRGIGSDNLYTESRTLSWCKYWKGNGRTWRKINTLAFYIWFKQQRLELRSRHIYLLLDSKFELKFRNKKAVLKPISTYGILLWNMKSFKILQSIMHRVISDTIWYFNNMCLHKEFNLLEIEVTLLVILIKLFTLSSWRILWSAITSPTNSWEIYTLWIPWRILNDIN